MPQDRPNIILIMTDQQRGDCMSVENHPVLLTPNMDALALDGARFSHAYTTCPSCVPARRSLMSGQHPINTGMVGYKDGVEWESPPPLLPQVLRDHGYQTALIGRSMHMHPKRKRYGFEQMVHTGGPESDYVKWLNQHTEPEHFNFHNTGPAHNDWTARPWPLDEHTHPTNYTVTEALKWLENRDPTAPFFLTVQFLAPHPPLVPPAFYLDRYLRAGVPDPVIGDWAQPPARTGRGAGPTGNKLRLTGEALQSTRAAYYGLINHVDDQLRRLLLPMLGAGVVQDDSLKNTWIIFTSDHGEMLGDHYGWGKRTAYEPSARIPMCIRPPRGVDIKREHVIDQPVCLEDIMPTCLDIADVDIPESVDGHSMLSLMRGESTQWRDHLHIEHAPQFQAVTDGREKFIWHVASGQEQFFDLTQDPEERHDRINDPDCAARVDHWRNLLIETLKDRPEDLTDGKTLNAGVRYAAVLEHAHHSPWKDAQRASSLA